MTGYAGFKEQAMSVCGTADKMLSIDLLCKIE